MTRSRDVLEEATAVRGATKRLLNSKRGYVPALQFNHQGDLVLQGFIAVLDQMLLSLKPLCDGLRRCWIIGCELAIFPLDRAEPMQLASIGMAATQRNALWFFVIAMAQPPTLVIARLISGVRLTSKRLVSSSVRMMWSDGRQVRRRLNMSRFRKNV
jgi:hypothetical protein